MQQLCNFIDRLEESSIHFNLKAYLPRAVTVEVCVPGERWEVEFNEDGEVSYEVFVSRNGVESGKLSELFDRFSDNDG